MFKGRSGVRDSQPVIYSYTLILCKLQTVNEVERTQHEARCIAPQGLFEQSTSTNGFLRPRPDESGRLPAALSALHSFWISGQTGVGGPGTAWRRSQGAGQAKMSALLPPQCPACSRLRQQHAGQPLRLQQRRPITQRVRPQLVRAEAARSAVALPVRDPQGEDVGSVDLSLKVAPEDTAKGLVHRYLVMARQNARSVRHLVLGISFPA